MPDVNRKLRGQQTRARIAETAARLFVERGYQGTPMDAIATEAGVAVQTVYFSFRTKPELLIAAYDHAVKGGLNAPAPHEQAWARDALDQDDPALAIRGFADGVMGIIVRSGPLHPVMDSSPDEEVRDAFHHRQNGRYEAYRRVIQSLNGRGNLKPDLHEREATDLLYAVLSPELHGVFCTERGWTTDQFKTWAVSTLEAQLLQP